MSIYVNVYVNITISSFVSCFPFMYPWDLLPTSHCSTHKCTSSPVGQHVTANWSFIHFNSSYTGTIFHVFFCFFVCVFYFLVLNSFPIPFIMADPTPRPSLIPVLHLHTSCQSIAGARRCHFIFVTSFPLPLPLPPCESIIRTSHSFIARSSSSISCPVCDRPSALIRQPITAVPLRPSPPPLSLSRHTSSIYYSSPSSWPPGEHKPFQAAYHVRSLSLD